MDKQVNARLSFIKQWNKIKPLVAVDRIENKEKFKTAKDRLHSNNEVKNALLDIFTEGNEVFLKDAVMRFPDRHSLWIQIHEILLNENYYFESNTDSPLILDCGTHFGLAIYYFKNLYPKSRIIGFEPVPTLRKIALENIRRNNYSDIEILPYALSDCQGTMPMYISKVDSMAASLTERRRVFGELLTEITVKCHQLSDYLHESVDFLKLDIEGSEEIVLKESQHLLENVQHIFCEYHHAGGLETDRLGNILLLLDKYNFDTQIGKSLHYRQINHQPMNFVQNPYSVEIWAKKRKNIKKAR